MLFIKLKEVVGGREKGVRTHKMRELKSNRLFDIGTNKIKLIAEKLERDREIKETDVSFECFRVRPKVNMVFLAKDFGRLKIAKSRFDGSTAVLISTNIDKPLERREDLVPFFDKAFWRKARMKGCFGWKERA